MGRLDNKVAVITGGASGIGRATVLRFLAEGASVVVADLNEAGGKETVDFAHAQGHADRIRFIRTDVASEPDIEAMVNRAETEFGHLDIVVNNAGLVGAVGPVTETPVEHWDYTFAVLTRGVFLGIKHGARAMRRAGQGGSIINTASVAGLTGGNGPPAYSAAKAAVINLTKSAAVELAHDLIRVNAICPGAINTALTSGERPTEEIAPRMAMLQPLPIAGEPAHIAGTALFLASDDSAFVTGEALVVDGGLTALGASVWSLRPPPGHVGVTDGTIGQEPSDRRGENGPGPSWSQSFDAR